MPGKLEREKARKRESGRKKYRERGAVEFALRGNQARDAGCRMQDCSRMRLEGGLAS